MTLWFTAEVKVRVRVIVREETKMIVQINYDDLHAQSNHDQQSNTTKLMRHSASTACILVYNDP
jgi:hypothetical protein